MRFFSNIIKITGLFLVLFSSGCDIKSEPDNEAKKAVGNTFLNAIDFSAFDSLLNNSSSIHPETKELDRMIEDFMNSYEVTGASVAVVKDGRLVYARGFGYADKEKKILMQPFHTMRIASISKLVTAVAIMKLVESGKISLNDQVFGKEGILSEYSEMKDKRMAKIKIIHLLTHTSGFRNRFRADPIFRTLEIALFQKKKPPAKLEDVIQFMLGEEIIAEPGEFADYSNFGYAVLGKIIEKKTGMTYEDYTKKEILLPLGIQRMKTGENLFKNKDFWESKYYDHKKAERRLSIYGTGDSASRVYEGTNIEVMEGAGGWIGSASDLLRLVVAIDGFKTSPDILTKESISRMIAEKDTTGKMVLGWRQCDKSRWVRTGSLASTSSIVIRRQDGITWAFITNTGSWRGPYFVYDIEGLMNRGLRTVKNWRKDDLFLQNYQ